MRMRRTEKMRIVNKVKLILAYVDIVVGIALARYNSYAKLLERLANITAESSCNHK